MLLVNNSQIKTPALPHFSYADSSAALFENVEAEVMKM